MHPPPLDLSTLETDWSEPGATLAFHWFILPGAEDCSVWDVGRELDGERGGRKREWGCRRADKGAEQGERRGREGSVKKRGGSAQFVSDRR